MNPITTVEQATQAGAYDRQAGQQGAYAKAFNPKQLLNNNDAQNQLLANGNPAAFDMAADKAGFSKLPTSPLNATEIGQVSPYVLPPASTAAASAGLQGAIDSGMDATSQAKAFADSQVNSSEVAGLKTDDSNMKAQIAGLFDKLSSKGSRQEEVYKAEGVDTSKQAVTEINNQILAEKNALNKQREAIFTNGGLTKEQAQQQYGEIERKSLSKQADMSIISYVANNKYADAVAIADRKIESEFEPVQQKLDAVKFFYQENKADLSKKEDQRFQLLLGERERILGDQKEAAKTLQTTKLQVLQEAQANGASSSELMAIQNAQTPEEVMEVGGKYVGAFERNMQRQNLAISQGNLNLAKQKYDDEKKLNDSAVYTPKQLTALSKLNQDVSKNATFAKTTSMRGYIQNVEASLGQNTGVGDIAAINQFQKVIDEGAVTRDQDVQLIQGSQSLASKLQTKVKKLQKGEQLSPELRTQMLEATQKMYQAQVKALENDPYIKAKTREAELYGLTGSDTIISELGGFTGNTAPSAPTVVPSAQVPAGYYQASDGKFYKK